MLLAGYEVKSTTDTGSGLQVKLKLIGEGCQAFGYDYQDLCVDVEYQSKERLRVHIYDAGHVEYQGEPPKLVNLVVGSGSDDPGLWPHPTLGLPV